MKHTTFFIALLSVVLWSSCRKDFETVTSSGGLEFSMDTIYFDTIFTNIKSATKELKVYNRTDEAITIPEIYLELGNDSKYQLNVDGLPSAEAVVDGSTGKAFTNIDIQANDSIFVFAEILVDLETDDIEEDSFYNDKILFTGLNETQEVPLITSVFDATFIVQSANKEIRGFETTTKDDEGNFITVEGYDLTTDQLNFTNEKPYVIYGNIIVPAGETLIIDAGARIHFHEDSGLIVESGASLQMNGTESSPENPTENQIIISSDRFGIVGEGSDGDVYFDQFPGQWNFIWIMEGSTGNSITNTSIKNSSIGLLVDGNGTETIPSITLRNVEIYNSQAAGIQANGTYIVAENVIINQNGEPSLNIEQGGTYNFNHCTIVNSNLPDALSINNQLNPDTNVTNSDLNATFYNCIIVGNSNGFTKIELNNNEENEFGFNFTNCLLDISETANTEQNPELDIENTDFYTACIFNGDPDFKNARNNELQIGEDSAANGTALFLMENSVDIIGTQRDTDNPDIGAYESIIFEDILDENTP